MQPPNEPGSAEPAGGNRPAGEGQAGTIGAAEPAAALVASARAALQPVGSDSAALGRAELGRLRWRCRRGMRELDELLTRYVDEQYATASAPHQAAFRELLDSHDPLIYAYFLGRRTPRDPVLSSLIDRITAGPGND